VEIRGRTAADDSAIRWLNDDAFGGTYESRLIEDLRAADLDAVELVAVEKMLQPGEALSRMARQNIQARASDARAAKTFEDDTPDQRLARLKQANLVGPAGYVSMEDGCVGGFVQRGIAGSPNEQAVLEMGGSVAESSESRVTEASVRGFWKAYRTHMGL